MTKSIPLIDTAQAIELGGEFVNLMDVRAYSPKLVAVMTLDDAVTFANAVLAFVTDEVLASVCPTCGSTVCDCVTPGYRWNFVAPFGPEDLPV